MSAIEIIPTELKTAGLGGISTETANHVFGNFWHSPQLSKDKRDETSLAASLTLSDLRSVYGRDGLVYQPYSYGLMHGVEYLRNLLSAYSSICEAVGFAEDTLNQRLCAVDRIQAAYLSRCKLSREQRLYDQDERLVSEQEAYVWGCREGLKYAVKVAQTTVKIEAAHSYQALGSVMGAFGFAASSQRDFVVKRLPSLRDRFHDRPCFYAVDIMVQGWSSAFKFIETHLPLVKASNSAKGGIEDLGKELESKLADCEPQTLLGFVCALRAHPMMFHTFKLGFGRNNLRPNPANTVFMFHCQAQDVHIADILELLLLHEQAGSSSTETWLREVSTT